MARVILYSGGLDSYIMKALYYRRGDILLHITTGTEDNVLEGHEFRKTIRNIGHTIVNMDFLGKWELPNKIVPFRNCFFILAAAQYRNEIYMGATQGDTTKDKDYVFKATMEVMLNYFALDTNKRAIPDYPYEIKMPFKNMTKTEIVKRYLEEGHLAYKLVKNTFSCYTPDAGGMECGECRACLRKWVALINNGVQTDMLPCGSVLDSFLEECIQKNRGQEVADVNRALDLSVRGG